MVGSVYPCPSFGILIEGSQIISCINGKGLYSSPMRIYSTLVRLGDSGWLTAPNTILAHRIIVHGELMKW